MCRFDSQFKRWALLLAVAGSFFLATSARAQGPPPFVPNRLLVKFNPQATAQQVHSLLVNTGSRAVGEIGHIGIYVLQLPPEADEEALANAFNHRPEVSFAEVDSIVPPSDTTPNDKYYSSQWHLPKIKAPTAWSATTGSASVIIAILDTGCDPTHPDLSPNYVSGWNVYDNNSNTADVYGTSGHGTLVAGTAAAATNNGIGVAGVVWNSKIMPIRISDTSGNTTYSLVANGLTWATDHGARVANISYIMSDSSTVSSAAQYFEGKGGVVSISAGNNSSFDNTKDNPYVLTVSATDESDALCSFSNTGNNIDLAAPGDWIMTTIKGGQYGYSSGTSFSAPIVAGIAALVISANPNLTGAQVQDILKQSADDLGTSGWDTKYGWGRVNAAAAVAQALSAVVDTTVPTVSILSPADGASVSNTITVQVDATDNVGVSSVDFYVDDVLVSSLSASPYNFSWNSSSVANGSHTLKAVASDAANNSASASISVTVSNTADTAAPTCSILSPSSSTKVGTSITVTASASDNIGVTKVEVYVDGKLKATDTASPYSFTLSTRKWPSGSHTIQCKAYDGAGNVGLSQIIAVSK